MQTVVINRFKKSPEGRQTAYIGRPSIFGNPHGVGYCEECHCHHDRDSAINAYYLYFHHRIGLDRDFHRKVESLRGKALRCYCAPLPCHGDVIAAFLNDPENGELKEEALMSERKRLIQRHPRPWSVQLGTDYTRDDYLVNADGVRFAIVHYLGDEPFDKAFAELIVEGVNALSKEKTDG